MSLHLRRSIHAAIQRRLAAHALAMLGTLLVASSDEIHQHFLPNRSGSPWDVLIDCSGGLLMQVLIWMWMSRRANS
jgi:VanZ family protein